MTSSPLYIDKFRAQMKTVLGTSKGISKIKPIKAKVKLIRSNVVLIKPHVKQINKVKFRVLGSIVL